MNFKYSHLQDTPYCKTIFFDTYEDALNALRYYWKNDRKFYYHLDAYINRDRKQFGAFKYKIFPKYHCYSNGDSYGEPYEYYISWRPEL